VGQFVLGTYEIYRGKSEDTKNPKGNGNGNGNGIDFRMP
jgi:hypothetical protein